MDLRCVYTFTIFFVIFYATIVVSYDWRPCDAEECDAECKYRLKMHHGRCHLLPFGKERKKLCYCYPDELHWPDTLTTTVTWCRDEEPDYRCPPIFNRNTPNCKFNDCQHKCRQLYEGKYFMDVSGTCKLTDACKCYGKETRRFEDDDIVWFSFEHDFAKNPIYVQRLIK